MNTILDDSDSDQAQVRADLQLLSEISEDFKGDFQVVEYFWRSRQVENILGPNRAFEYRLGFERPSDQTRFISMMPLIMARFQPRKASVVIEFDTAGNQSIGIGLDRSNRKVDDALQEIVSGTIVR